MSFRHIFEDGIKINKGFSSTEYLESSMFTEKRLSRQELLEVSLNVSRYYAPKISFDDKKLVLLAVDSQHLHAYWNLLENQPKLLSEMPSSNELLLRVDSVQQGKTRENDKKKPIIEIKINDLRSKQIIKLPMAEVATVYSARIGKVFPKRGFVSLIKSNNTHTVQEKTVQDAIDRKDFVNRTNKQFQNILSSYSLTSQL